MQMPEFLLTNSNEIGIIKVSVHSLNLCKSSPQFFKDISKLILFFNVGNRSGCMYKQVVIKVLNLLTFLVIKIWKLHFLYYKRHKKSLIC